MSDLVLLERADWVKSAKEIPAGETLEPLRKGIASKVRKVDEENRSFEIVISSETEDRDGDVITLKGWLLKHFRKNPVVQWAHDHRMPAIARSTKITVEDTVLVGEPQFPAEGIHPFADMIFNLYVARIINASSVGFIPIEVEPLDPEDTGFWAPLRFLKQELLEFSLVNVPSNPEALGRAKSLGINIAPLREWAMGVLDGEAGEGGLWLPKSKIERALQIVENDRTAIAMDGYKLIPGTKDKEAAVVIEIPIPRDLGISAADLDKRLTDEVVDEAVIAVTDAIMAEPEEETASAVVDEEGIIDSVILSRVSCEHCETETHKNLVMLRLHKDRDEFYALCPETNKPIVLVLSDLLSKGETTTAAAADVTDTDVKTEPGEEEEEEGKGTVETEEGDVMFEKADGAQLLSAFLNDKNEEKQERSEPDDFVKGVGEIIKTAIGQSAKEAVREHLTAVTGKLD